MEHKKDPISVIGHWDVYELIHRVRNLEDSPFENSILAGLRQGGVRGVLFAVGGDSKSHAGGSDNPLRGSLETLDLTLGLIEAAKKSVVLLQTKEDLDTLGVMKHKLNWYFAGIFRDVRTRGEAGWKGKHYVRLDVTYYTGLLDAVPHIPDACLGAGGFTIIPDESQDTAGALTLASYRDSTQDLMNLGSLRVQAFIEKRPPKFR